MKKIKMPTIKAQKNIALDYTYAYGRRFATSDYWEGMRERIKEEKYWAEIQEWNDLF